MKNANNFSCLVELLVSWLFILFHPSFWVMDDPYDPDWNNELGRLIQDSYFTKIARNWAVIGNKTVWIANYPYAAFTVVGKGITSRRRPSRWTIYKSWKKLIYDLTNR